MNDSEIIKEFLVESDENLVRLDQEIIQLETDPKNPELVASIFRTIHTIKGTCGFLGFDTLTSVSHAAESILSQVREGKREVTQRLINIILEAVDAIKQLLMLIEETGTEGDRLFSELTSKLQNFADAGVDEISENDQTLEIRSDSYQDRKSQPESDGPAKSEPNCFTPSLVIPAAEAEPRSKTTEPDRAADATIRVGVGLLDSLMTLVGELVLARNQILQFSSRIENASLLATSQRLNLITSELQERVMKTRLQPIGTIWSKFPRVVRDIAASVNKQIAISMDGADTELDRTIIEAIKDPLTHIIRNSCDHGIEKPEDRVAKGKAASGKLSLRAFHEGGSVNIEIADDGAGIQPEKVKNKAIQKGLISSEQAVRMSEREAINLVFMPGFSTAEQVSNISGRGVGMDVVKTNIEKIGGTVDIVSAAEKGTTVKVKIPLTLSIIPGLVVTSGGERFVIPQVSLSELVRLEAASSHKHLERINGATVYRRRGKLLPLSYLNEVLGMAQFEGTEDATNIIILQAEGHDFGLVVDAVNDTQEIVVKPLGKQLKGVTTYSGATIMGDGKVALILDVLGLAQRSGVLSDHRLSLRTTPATEESGTERQTLLLFCAGVHQRVAIPLSLVARLEEIAVSSVERAAGRWVTQYRGQLLYLIPLIQYLDPSAYYPISDQTHLQVIVFNRDGNLIGLIVDRIVDIVDECISVRSSGRARGISGSAVMGQRVTDLLDLSGLLAAMGEQASHESFAQTDGSASDFESSSLERLSFALSNAATVKENLALRN